MFENVVNVHFGENVYKLSWFILYIYTSHNHYYSPYIILEFYFFAVRWNQFESNVSLWTFEIFFWANKMSASHFVLGVFVQLSVPLKAVHFSKYYPSNIWSSGMAMVIITMYCLPEFLQLVFYLGAKLPFSTCIYGWCYFVRMKCTGKSWLIKRYLPTLGLVWCSALLCSAALVLIGAHNMKEVILPVGGLWCILQNFSLYRPEF